MEATIVCVYAKFGRCKNEKCKFPHSQKICCDKTCDIYSCLRKHPHHCRYFWGFDSCRNGESCKFLHRQEASNIADDNKYKDLEEKYNNILEKYNNALRRIDSLENINEPQTRPKAALPRSRGDGKRKIKSDNNAIIDNDNKVKHGGENVANNESINKNRVMETESTKSNNIDSTSVIYVKEEAIIKLKTFVQNKRMVNEERKKCKRKIQKLTLKVKHSANIREKHLVGFFN